MFPLDTDASALPQMFHVQGLETMTQVILASHRVCGLMFTYTPVLRMCMLLLTAVDCSLVIPPPPDGHSEDRVRLETRLHVHILVESRVGVDIAYVFRLFQYEHMRVWSTVQEKKEGKGTIGGTLRSRMPQLEILRWQTPRS